MITILVEIPLLRRVGFEKILSFLIIISHHGCIKGQGWLFLFLFLGIRKPDHDRLMERLNEIPVAKSTVEIVNLFVLVFV